VIRHDSEGASKGRCKEILPALLVPGDIIELSSGDKTPADCRLIELRSAVLSVDESMLTGESENLMKQVVCSLLM
jgi:Ca2+ transporting ATPase